MERSAEFWRGADWQWVHGATRAHIAEELADAEAREAFPIPDTLPEVPETREAGEKTTSTLPEVSTGGVRMSGNTTDQPTTAEVIAVGDNNNFYVPVFNPDKANESSAKRDALAVVMACEKYLKEMLSSMPDKIDPRMKYREVQYRDSELDDIRQLLALIAKWKAGRG